MRSRRKKGIGIHILIAAVLLVFMGQVPASAMISDLPLNIPENNWQPLYTRVNPDLQKGLEKALDGHKAWRNLILGKKMAVGLVDLSDPSAPRFAHINGGTMMYAASLPKIAILLAAYVSFEDGSLKENPEIHKDLVAMIRTSNNQAATRMIERMGFEKIREVLMNPRYHFYDMSRGGLWVGKKYAKAGKRIPDPVKGLSHGATVNQICRFYYLLANGRIINPERSGEMLEILSEPGIHHKFVCELQKRVPLERLFRKSGTWRCYHADSILVWGDKWRKYILTALVECSDGEQIMRDLVSVAEEVLHPDVRLSWRSFH